MRRRLRRFAAIGLLATLVDVGVLLGLTRRRGWRVAPADVAAIVAAAGVSYGLNRAITFGDDPTVRWVDHPSSFVMSASMAGAVDVAVLSTLVATGGSTSGRSLFAAKLPALAAAAGIRQAAYRWVLFSEVRNTLGERRLLAPATGAFRLSLVVPAFNDEARIAETVARIRTDLAMIDEAGGVEVVVVDDGSPDRTAEVARTAGADQVIVLPENRGKGAAVRAGMLAARGRSVVFTDADLAYAPRQVVRVLEELESGWDVVVGSRKHTDTTTLVRAGRLREIGGRGINLLTNAVLLGQYRDTQCGLKGFRSDVAKLLFRRTRIDGFAFDVELFHLVERYRLSLAEVPVEVENSDQSTVRVVRDALALLHDLGRVLRGGRRGWYDLTPDEALPEAA